jgi:hypothetical protein
MRRRNQKNGFKNQTKTEKMEPEENCERRIMTRNRVRELGVLPKREVIGRRIISPGVFQFLVQNVP